MNFEQQQLPRCFFPLTTPQARREYKLVGRTLAEAGRLTLAAHRALSSFCLQLDVVFKAISEGKHVRAHQFATMDKARAQLKLEELETLRPVQRESNSPAPENKFARCGLVHRRGAALNMDPASSGSTAAL
jgi:phage terminase small subunit